ncbi:hypothetical protein JX265_005546 [Neoarthrinium moseri]|uniref:Uncharacterized protein n=1 Tax=Neoarthrinium moseri TaxID=1658444 RepID=A0A9P9WNT8_9PEZI|nr:hypothetical protein JX265_005546 [Neoarthrinium moseri]
MGGSTPVRLGRHWDEAVGIGHGPARFAHTTHQTTTMRVHGRFLFWSALAWELVARGAGHGMASLTSPHHTPGRLPPSSTWNNWAAVAREKKPVASPETLKGANLVPLVLRSQTTIVAAALRSSHTQGLHSSQPQYHRSYT